MLRPIDIVLVTENANGHIWARDAREFDGSRETLVTLRVIVFETDLELDGLEEVALLLLVRVMEELLHVLTHTSDRDLRHDGGLPILPSMVGIGTALALEKVRSSMSGIAKKGTII